MDWTASLAILLGTLCVLMATGMPVAFAFIGVNILGAILFLGGEPGLVQLARNAFASLTNFTLAPIPLFVLMGAVLFHTGLAFRAIEATDRLISRVPGRLAVVSVVGGTIFATLSGSSIANTAMLGNSVLPDMLKRGYHRSMAMGPILATGGIAVLIPPSALAVLLGSLAQIPIADLLIAGLVPGLLMSVLFLGYIVLRCGLRPELAPAGEEERPLSGWARVGPFVVHVVPLFSIFAVVVGSMLLGLATPTEAAALGCAAATAAAAAYRRLSLKALALALSETARVSVMLLFVIVASLTFSQLLSFSGATRGLLGVVTGLDLGVFQTVALMMLVLIFLGAFMDQVSMLMVTVPFFMPLAAGVGIEPVWLGVLMLICLEISFLTPPFGLLIFVMKGVAPPGIALKDVYAAALPFVALEIVVLVAVLLFPALAWVPG